MTGHQTNILWLALLLAGISVGCGGLSARPHLFVTGKEREVIDAAARASSEPQPTRTFANDLDRAIHVFQSKSCPPLKASTLAAAAVGGACEEFARVSGRQVSSVQKDGWVADAQRTGSFEEMLRTLTEGPDIGRASLVNAAVIAVCKGPAKGRAWLLSGPEAAQIKTAAASRQQVEPGVLGLNLEHWPLLVVVPDQPAAEAGILDGDRVVSVNGTSAAAAGTVAEALELLAGPVGQQVAITIERDGGRIAFHPRRISRAAAAVTGTSVGGHLAVRIPSFEGDGIAERVARLVHRLPAGRAVLIDVRDNPGGRPEQANAVADLFLDAKRLQVFRFRDRSVAFRSHAGAVNMAVIVLTNRQTGSAAEMLAMALRDNAVATIVGEPTAGMLFGKETEELQDGRLLVLRAYPTILSPNGSDYSANGVPPDIAVVDERALGRDAILERAIALAAHRGGQ